jgi:membrane protease YdiL (CAAX protease family)
VWGGFPGLVVCALAIAACLLSADVRKRLNVSAEFGVVSGQLAQKNDVALPEPGTPLTYSLAAVMLLLVAIGVFVPPAVLVGAALHPPLREGLERLLAWMARRPLPAVGFVDAVAAFCVYMAAQQYALTAAFVALRGAGPGTLIATALVMNDVAMAVAVLVALWLACRRGGGVHGALGFFPPWSRRFVWPKRSFFADVGLGLACYPFALAGTLISMPLNRLITPDADQHAIVAMLKNHSSPGVVAAIMISATFGAAFFEETLFRGVLYNALRKHLGGPTGAILGAFIFAQMHGLPSQLFALFVLGLVLTWLYDKTGRLIAGMTLHFTVNSMSTVNLLLLLSQHKT